MGGMGISALGGAVMTNNFCYISKKDPHLKNVYDEATHLIREVQNEVRGKFTFQYKPAGSYVRNMITYDKNSNTGFDLDFDLIVNDVNGEYSAKQIKNILQQAIKKVAPKYGYTYPEDSTRVLTIKHIDKNHPKILHSIDFAILKEAFDNSEKVSLQCIQFNKRHRQYIWCDQTNREYDLQKKIMLLKKDKRLWNKLREYYLEKKKNNTNPHLHSRQLFSMSVNEMLQKYDLTDNANDEKIAARERSNKTV